MRCYELEDTQCGKKKRINYIGSKSDATGVEVIPSVHTIWFKGKEGVLPENFTGE